MEFYASVAQMNSGFDLDQNLDNAKELIQSAAADNSKLLVLPENFVMFNSSGFEDVARQEAETKKVSSFLSFQAQKNNIWIIAGSVPTISNTKGKVFSSCLVFDNKGRQCSSYNKIHLFDVDVDDAHGQYRESNYIEAGSEAVVCDAGFAKIGLVICYDLRFPELFRQMLKDGVNVFVIPSAFTKLTGSLHWEVLLRARAIENQCYVLASNQGGVHISPSGKKRETYGHSMIIDPNGKVMKVLKEGVGVISEKIDLTYLKKIRKNMPVLDHKVL